MFVHSHARNRINMDDSWEDENGLERAVIF